MCQVGYQVEYSSSSSSSPAAATYVTAQRLLTWPSHATSVKIPPPFVHISFKSKLELLLASKQASMFASLKLRFDLSWGGEIVNTDFPVVFYEPLPHSAVDPATQYHVFRWAPIGICTHFYTASRTMTN